MPLTQRRALAVVCICGALCACSARAVPPTTATGPASPSATPATRSLYERCSSGESLDSIVRSGEFQQWPVGSFDRLVASHVGAGDSTAPIASGDINGRRIVGLFVCQGKKVTLRVQRAGKNVLEFWNHQCDPDMLYGGAVRVAPTGGEATLHIDSTSDTRYCAVVEQLQQDDS